MQPDAVISLVGNLSAVGFVVWLAHRLMTRTIPEMAEQFSNSSAQQRDDFRDALDRQRRDFTDFHRREHEAHETRLQSVMDKCLARGTGDTQ